MKEQEIKALVSLLDDEDSEVVGHVEKKIVSMGHKIIPFLEEDWDQKTPVIQQKLEDLIQGMQFEMVKVRLQTWVENKDEEDEDRRLLKGMWILASYQYPSLTFPELKKMIEQLYYEVWLEFKYDMHPFDQIKVLNSILFYKLGFKANTKDFHAPANSMINQVISNKTGNPISLCIIYMLIGRKLKLPIYGVNLPNLFILTYKNDSTQFYINAFNKGLIFSKADIDNYISQLNLKPKDIYYEACTNQEIVRRVIRNLAVAFEKKGESKKVDDFQTLLKIVEEN
ncbi:transglutaminase-like domain-containing protein [Flammeovirgaceae bacterium SG7u.111]|nr:transglutaminase-like domain-containing protein [Flammeovirgaceae bacterium SG7u.132]WPO36933.1 transglutaminase-like domain-containing protein [Flammeovirgaceae bacterium SG7u.111]